MRWMPLLILATLVAAQPSRVAPAVRICVLQDMSGSIQQTRTEILKPDQLRRLAQVINQRGGEIAFGLIAEQSDRPLLRLPLDIIPPEPEKPKNPLLQKQFEKKKAEWNQKMQDRRTRIDQFAQEVQSRMGGPLSKKTDVCGGIRRCDLFLAEPYGRPSLDFLLVVSDGLHNVRSSPCPEALRSRARLLLVNGEGLQGVLSPYRPTPFEAIDPAVEFIRREVEKNP
jgi:hypothetical protein